MKRIWLISLIICLALTVLWFLRWEKGPTQATGGFKTIHIRDRWTNQRWLQYYGFWEGNGFYSGEMDPHITSGAIHVRAKKVLKSPEGEAKRQPIQKKIDAAEKVKAQNSKEHTQYVRLYENTLGQGRLMPLDPYTDLIDGYKAWQKSNSQIKALNSELASLSKWAAKEAERQLKREAFRYRTVATWVWICMVIASATTALVLFLRSQKQITSDQQMNSPA